MPQAARQDTYVAEIYEKLLGHRPDEDGLAHYTGMLERGEITRPELVRHLKSSTEYWLRRFPGDIPRRSLENTALNDRETREKKTVLRSRPYIFNIDLIGTCNMTPPCRMCLNWRNGVGPRHHKGLKLADIKRFGEHLQLAHEVINCGIGEPLLNRDLIPILQLFHDWGKLFGFNSNGLALSPALTERLVPYFEILTILFSIDAATAETYAKIRGRFFDRVVKNIAYYSARRREVAPDGLASKTGIVFMPMRSNRHETADFIRMGARLGVDVVELRALNWIKENWVVRRGGFTFNYHQEVLTPAELEEIRQEAMEVAAAEGVRLDCQYQVSPESTFFFFIPPQYRDLGIRCILPWRFILPYQNGNTAPCCFITDDLGDWRKTGLEKLWNGPFMQKLRGQMATGKLPDLCRRFPSCPVVQATLSEEQRLRPASAVTPTIPPAPDISAMPPALRTMVPQKHTFLSRAVQAVRKRFNLELNHSLGELLARQEKINRALAEEIERLRAEVAESHREQDKRHG
jgi:MoaA/NifB/PqqE/SkfB family radical SAM enzyme